MEQRVFEISSHHQRLGLVRSDVEDCACFGKELQQKGVIGRNVVHPS